MYHLLLTLLLVWSTGTTFAQSEDAYNTGSTKSGTLLLDPSRLTVHNSVSFGAMTGGGSGSLQSQSLYTTMMRYQFTKPVTLNLNFSLPIHSSFSPMQNLNQNNLQSLDYFKSVPFEMSLSWKPTDNTSVHFSIVKPAMNGYLPGASQWGNSSLFLHP
jgi:hypothetical protein